MLKIKGVIVIVSPSPNESIGDIVGDDASKKMSYWQRLQSIELI